MMTMGSPFRKLISFLTLVAFVLISVPSSYAQTLVMPAPGTMVSLSASYQSPVLQGIKVYSENPFRFDFILNPGQDTHSQDALKDESNKLIRYFLASLTVPENDLWVNLSPYEKDRIITSEFGKTEMGRDLLSQDYLLKQITASVIYPEGETGKKFWAEVYKKAQEKFGTTDIPVDTFNKVWIVPAKAVVYEKAQGTGDKSREDQAVAYIVESKLKVMLESDYLARAKDTGQSTLDTRECFNSEGATGPSSSVKCQVSSASSSQDIAKQVLREIVIPILEKEVNEGQNFAPLRQVYQSLILAAWYKKKIKESILSKVYVDRKKVAGVEINDPKMSEKIWAQYVEAFKKGAYNYVKDEQDPLTQEVLPRKYFSGGVTFKMESAMATTAVVPQEPSVLMMIEKIQVNPASVPMTSEGKYASNPLYVKLEAGDADAAAQYCDQPVGSFEYVRSSWRTHVYRSVVTGEYYKFLRLSKNEDYARKQIADLRRTIIFYQEHADRFIMNTRLEERDGRFWLVQDPFDAEADKLFEQGTSDDAVLIRKVILQSPFVGTELERLNNSNLLLNLDTMENGHNVGLVYDEDVGLVYAKAFDFDGISEISFNELKDDAIERLDQWIAKKSSDPRAFQGVPLADFSSKVQQIILESHAVIKSRARPVQAKDGLASDTSGGKKFESAMRSSPLSTMFKLGVFLVVLHSAAPKFKELWETYRKLGVSPSALAHSIGDITKSGVENAAIFHILEYDPPSSKNPEGLKHVLNDILMKDMDNLKSIGGQDAQLMEQLQILIGKYQGVINNAERAMAGQKAESAMKANSLFEPIPQGFDEYAEIHHLQMLLDPEIPKKDDNGNTIQRDFVDSMLVQFVNYLSTSIGGRQRVVSVPLLVEMAKAANEIAYSRSNNAAYMDQKVLDSIIKAGTLEEAKNVLAGIRPKRRDDRQPVTQEFKDLIGRIFDAGPVMTVLDKIDNNTDGRYVEVLDLGEPFLQEQIKKSGITIVQEDKSVLTRYSDEELLNKSHEWTAYRLLFRVVVDRKGTLYFMKRSSGFDRSDSPFVIRSKFLLDYQESDRVILKTGARLYQGIDEKIRRNYESIMFGHLDKRPSNFLVKVSARGDLASAEAGGLQLEYIPIDNERVAPESSSLVELATREGLPQELTAEGFLNEQNLMGIDLSGQKQTKVPFKLAHKMQVRADKQVMNPAYRTVLMQKMKTFLAVFKTGRREILRVRGRDHGKTSYEVNADTVQGPYPENQDSYWFDKKRKRAAIVADGVGGIENGKLASQQAVKVVRRYIEGREFSSPEGVKDALMEGVIEANKKIVASNSGGATTISVVYIWENLQGGRHLVGVNLGDSGIFLERRGTIEQISKDDSAVQDFEEGYVFRKFFMTDRKYSNNEPIAFETPEKGAKVFDWLVSQGLLKKAFADPTEGRYRLNSSIGAIEEELKKYPETLMFAERNRILTILKWSDQSSPDRNLELNPFRNEITDGLGLDVKQGFKASQIIDKPLEPGDRVWLMSDGIIDNLGREEIRKILSEEGKTQKEKFDALFKRVDEVLKGRVDYLRLRRKPDDRTIAVIGVPDIDGAPGLSESGEQAMASDSEALKNSRREIFGDKIDDFLKMHTAMGNVGERKTAALRLAQDEEFKAALTNPANDFGVEIIRAASRMGLYLGTKSFQLCTDEIQAILPAELKPRAHVIVMNVVAYVQFMAVLRLRSTQVAIEQARLLSYPYEDRLAKLAEILIEQGDTLLEPEYLHQIYTALPDQIAPSVKKEDMRNVDLTIGQFKHLRQILQDSQVVEFISRSRETYPADQQWDRLWYLWKKIRDVDSTGVLFDKENPSRKDMTVEALYTGLPEEFLDTNGTKMGITKKDFPRRNKRLWQLHQAEKVMANDDKNGGIDLTPGQLGLQTTGSGGMHFKIDPAMLQQWENAPGVSAVIIDIQPLDNLRNFLGFQTDIPSLNAS